MNESLPFFGAENRAEGYRQKAVEMYQSKAERLQRARTSIAEVLERSLKHIMAGLDETAPFTEGAEVQIVSSLLPERGETGVIQSRHAVCGGTIYQVLRHDTTAAALQQHVVEAAAPQLHVMEPHAKTIQVQVPAGVLPGSEIQCATNDGRTIQVTVPQGALPGSIFTAAVPPTESNTDSEGHHEERRESDLSGFYLPEQLRLVSDITKDETARETLEVATEMIEAAKNETKTAAESELSLWRGWVLALYECKSRRDQMS